MKTKPGRSSLAVQEAQDSPLPTVLPGATYRPDQVIHGLSVGTYLWLRYWPWPIHRTRARCGHPLDPNDPQQYDGHDGDSPRCPACSHRRALFPTRQRPPEATNITGGRK